MATQDDFFSWLSANPDLNDTMIAEAMQASNVTPAQVAAVTGLSVGDVQSRYDAAIGSGNNATLGGVILAGDSWLAGDEKTNLVSSQLGQNVTNVAVGGSTTAETRDQLNAFIEQGGTFQPGTTIMLSTGGNDLMAGVNPKTVENNINNIVSTLGDLGVKVILAGAPTVSGLESITGSTSLKMDDLYKRVAAANNNTTVVDSMAGLLNDKSLVDSTGFHMTDEGKAAFTQALSDSYTKTENTSTPASNNTINSLTSQILGQNTTGLWSGEGFGSAAANAADMAKILSGIGITDISQFGKIDQYRPVETQYQTADGRSVEVQDGLFYQKQLLPDQEGGLSYQNVQISPEQVKTVYGQYNYGDETGSPFAALQDQSSVSMRDGQPSVLGVPAYGNIATGQVVPNTYSERQTGNAWGGTFAGSGNTGYRVQFDAQGKPYFYTTGASSNDLANLLSDNSPLSLAASLGAAYFGGPLGSAALAAAKGGDIGDIAKSALLSYGLNNVANGLIPEGGFTGNTLVDSTIKNTAIGMAKGASFEDALKDATVNSLLSSGAYYSGGSGGADAENQPGGFYGDPNYAGYNAIRSPGDEAITSLEYTDPFLDSSIYYQGGNNLVDFDVNDTYSPEQQALIDDLPGTSKYVDFDVNDTYSPEQQALIDDLLGTSKYVDFDVNDTYSPEQQQEINRQAVAYQNAINSLSGGTGGSSGLTQQQISALVKAGAGLFGTAGATSLVSNLLRPQQPASMPVVSGGGGAAPMFGAPYQSQPAMNMNNPAYYQQVQEEYNKITQQPRDVATPLSQWYASKYGA